MTLYLIVALLVFIVVVSVLLVRYVGLTVDSEFRNLAKAVSDAEYRGGELARLDGLLASLPLAPSAVDASLRKPSSGAARTLPPVLIALGAILLWGGAFAKPEERGLWLVAGCVVIGVAAVILMATLRRRRFDRAAHLLRYRADLRRLDGNNAGAADDLRLLLRLTPWDDAAWAELSDDLAELGDSGGSLDALLEASRLDPDYADYHSLAMSRALTLGRLDVAEKSLETWTASESRSGKPVGAKLAVYQAGMALAKGTEGEARAWLGKAVAIDEIDALDCIDADAALTGLKEFR